MQWLSFILPFSMGAVVVLQAGINRKIIVHWGLGGATLLNATILFSLSLIIALSGVAKFSLGEFRYWYIFPGILGLCLVMGLPSCVARWGAAHTFILVITTQIILSIAWDVFAEGIAFSWKKALGGVLVAIGSWVAIRL